MTIDTKRLETDAAYWRECGAPEHATHYCMKDKEFWTRCATSPCDKCIPRPTKPAAPEWNGEGLPPVGCECEFKTRAREGQSNFANNWERCTVNYASNSGCFLLDKDGQEIFMDALDYEVWFRPIRTKEQRQREELAEALNDFFFEGDGTLKAEDIADTILSLYNLEPKK